MKRSLRAIQESPVVALIAFNVIRPIVWLLLTFGSAFALFLRIQSQAQASACVLNDGVSPASMNTSNLPQSQVRYYDKNFIKNLKANTVFPRLAERRELPLNSGNQLELFMYQTLGANTSQAPEGTVGSGITVSVLNNNTTIGQYADYVNLSDLARATAIDPTLENIQRELAYRLGLSLSIITRNTMDGAATIDASVNANTKTSANSPFTRSDVTTNIQSMAGRNVVAFDRGKYAGVIHPFIVGDTVNDNANNSLVDVLKHTIEGQMKLEELPAPDGDEVQVMDWGGATFYQTTLVTQTPNFLGSGKTALRTYIVGEDGLIAISLGKKEGTQVGNGDWRNLQLWMRKLDEPSGFDPSRMIGGFTSYNTKYSVALPPDTTMRMRYVDSVSAIA